MISVGLLVAVAGIAIFFSTMAYVVITTCSGVTAKFNHIPRPKWGWGSKNQVYPVSGAAIGLVAGLLLMWGQTFSINTLLITVCAGFGGGYILRAALKKEGGQEKLRQTSAFFKAVAVRLQNGSSVPHSLRMAAVLAPAIQGPVHRCLQRWQFNPDAALQRLEHELDVPEANTLCYVLRRAHETGGEEVAEVLLQGARNLDYRAEAREEKGFAASRMRYLIYRLLPAFSVIALIMGAFAYHVQVGLQDTIQTLIP